MSSDPDDRYHGTLTITVLGVSNLHKITNFGIMDPFVTIALNQDKKSTRQIQDGGTECIFNETLYFNIDCQKTDLITIKVKHKTTFSSSTIGVFSLKMMDFVKYQKKKLKFQLVDEVNFQDRGVIELIQEYRGTNAPPMPNNTTVTSPAPPMRSNELPQLTPSPLPHQNHSAPSTPSPAPISPMNKATTPVAQLQPSLTVTPSIHPPVTSPPRPIVAAPVATPIATPVATPLTPTNYGAPATPQAVIAPPVVKPYQPPAVMAPPVIQSATSFGQGPYQPQMHHQPSPHHQLHTHVPHHSPHHPPPTSPFSQPPPQVPYGISSSYVPPPPTVPHHPSGSFGGYIPPPSIHLPHAQPQPLSPPSQHQIPLAPFQTLAVGLPHQDSRPFDDVQYLGPRHQQAVLSEMRVYGGHNVNGIQLVYSVNGQRLDGPIAGGGFGQPTALYLDVHNGERIEGVSGHVSEHSIEHLIIKTNRRQVRFGQSNAGEAFQLNIPPSSRVLGFYGTFSPKTITSLGAYTVYQK